MPSWLDHALLAVPVGLWAVTVVVLIRRGWSDRGAVLVAAASVPVMGLVPSVSNDYKLVLVVFPLAVLVVVMTTVQLKSMALWSGLFGLLGLEMVLLARSTVLAGWSVFANKYPLLVVLQVLILATVLLCKQGDERQEYPIGHG